MGHTLMIKMWHNLCNHLGVQNRNWKILLAYRFPINTAELMNLLDEVFDIMLRNHFYSSTTQTNLNRERIPICRSGSFIAVSRVIAEQIGVVAEINITPTAGNQFITASVEYKNIF